MGRDTAIVKDRNRRVRQEALREQLSKGGHVQHIIDIANKLSDGDTILETIDVQRLKAAADIKIKLIAKYIPDLKQTEIMGEIEHVHKHEGLQDADTRIREILGQGEAASNTALKPH